MNYTRNCPKCNNEIKYSTKYTFQAGQKNNGLCNSCRVRGSNNPMFGKKGNQNPFFGKHHTEEQKEKWSKNKKQKFQSLSKQEKQKRVEQAKTVLKKHSNNKHPYQIWLEKYGKEIADQKQKELNHKLSLALTGSNNHRFGKPAPIKSGNGYGGWYKNWYFRSLLELSYMINVIEKNNLIWRSAESKEFKITYQDYKGIIRNYFPDFLIEEKILIECKPQKLINTPLVQAKLKAAQQFCLQSNFEYQIITPQKLSFEKINKLYISKEIIFNEKSEQRFLNYKKGTTKHD